MVKLDALTSHLEECEFNPKRPVPCEQGCGLVVPKDELKVLPTPGIHDTQVFFYEFLCISEEGPVDTSQTLAH